MGAQIWDFSLLGHIPYPTLSGPRPPDLRPFPSGLHPRQTPRTRRLRRQWGSPKWGGSARKAAGSGGREPPRKASPPELCYLAVLVAGCNTKNM